ncbi:unnamed protein product, partial [Pleuronectes platessa]
DQALVAGGELLLTSTARPAPTDQPTALPTVQTPDHMQLGWSDGADGMNGQGGRRGQGESPDKHALFEMMKSWVLQLTLSHACLGVYLPDGGLNPMIGSSLHSANANLSAAIV